MPGVYPGVQCLIRGPMDAKQIAQDIQDKYGVSDEYRELVAGRINTLVKTIQKALNGKVEVKQKSFGNSLVPYIGDPPKGYTKEMIREFYDYWSEPNKSKTKLRWELEKTWDLEKRLKRWAGNNFGSSTTTQQGPVEKVREWI